MKIHRQTLTLDRSDYKKLPFALKLIFSGFRHAQEIKYRDGVIQVFIDRDKMVSELKKELRRMK